MADKKPENKNVPIIIEKSFAVPGRRYEAGEGVEVAPELAARWIASGKARRGGEAGRAAAIIKPATDMTAATPKVRG